MSFREVGEGRWVLDVGRGIRLEVVLLFSYTVAFWRWGDELVAEVNVGLS